MNAQGSQPWWEMKCVEKYRVNKEGFSEMMSLLSLVPAWCCVNLLFKRLLHVLSGFCRGGLTFNPPTELHSCWKDSWHLPRILRIEQGEEGGEPSSGVQIRHPESFHDLERMLRHGQHTLLCPIDGLERTLKTQPWWPQVHSFSVQCQLD